MSREYRILMKLRERAGDAYSTLKRFAEIESAARERGLSYGQYMALVQDGAIIPTERYFKDFAMLFDVGFSLPIIAETFGLELSDVETWWERSGCPQRGKWRYGEMSKSNRLKMAQALTGRRSA